ncbi:MAG: glycosyl hydrolase [Paludibacteraceae bacterium]|nr:glycosyl hydrolase [Paludibacteraceae bacterium]
MRHFNLNIVLGLILLLGGSANAQQPRSLKRGTCTNDMGSRANFEVLSSGLSWFYNWSTKAPKIVQNDWESIGMDYAPMIWGRGIDGENYKKQLCEYIEAHPSIQYLLAFNEPNFSSQSNLTPKQAAALWPHIEEVANQYNLTIVGPAVNYAPQNGTVTEDGKSYANPHEWYEAFFKACPDCRVDHLAIHLYMPTGATATDINRLAEKYNKPVWLTEFNYNSGGNATAEDHIRFITHEIEALEKNPHVFRYAWFMSYGMAREANLLAPGEGVLTDLGKVYVGMSSFDSTYYSPIKTPIPAAHYQEANGISLTASQNDNSISICMPQSEAYAEYLVDVPSTNTYDLIMHLCCKKSTKITIIEDGNVLATLQPEPTTGTEFDTWAERSVSVNLTQGKHHLRIKSEGRMFYMDTFSIGKAESDIPQIKQQNTTPVKVLEKGQLMIQSNGKHYTILGLQQ